MVPGPRHRSACTKALLCLLWGLLQNWEGFPKIDFTTLLSQQRTGPSARVPPKHRPPLPGVGRAVVDCARPLWPKGLLHPLLCPPDPGSLRTLFSPWLWEPKTVLDLWKALKSKGRGIACLGPKGHLILLVLWQVETLRSKFAHQ